MGEDSNNGWPGKASYLAGASLAGYSASMGADWQVMGEIADTRGRLHGGKNPDDNRTYVHGPHTDGDHHHVTTPRQSPANPTILHTTHGSRGDKEYVRCRAP